MLKNICYHKLTEEYYKFNIMKTKWTELTKEDKDYIKSVYSITASHKERIEIVQKRYGSVASRTVRYWWKKLGIRKYDSESIQDLDIAEKHAIPSNTDILFVTSAQNNTPISKTQLANMQAYAKKIKEEYNKRVTIVVCTVKYRNPTTLAEKDKENINWNKDILSYLYYDKLQFGDCTISARSRVQPTAKFPLNGFEMVANGNHLILGHPKYQMKVVPHFNNEYIHIMTTSGSITRKNYSDSRAGEHGELNHVYGFTIVEKVGDKCLVPRFVNCTSEGNFIDLNWKAENGKISRNTTCKGLILGDIHNSELDEDLFSATIKLFNKVRPDSVFVHDLFNGESVNPHEVLDLYIKKRKIDKGRDDVKKELYDCAEFINNKLTKIPSDNYYIIESNHDVFLDRWINNFNWKQDLHNSEIYLELASLQQDKYTKFIGNIFGTFITKECCKRALGKVTYLPYGISVKVADIICSMHGDFGVSGAKGNVSSFGRLSMKSYTGHTHSHEVVNGAYSVGCSCVMNQYYTRKGASKWSQGHGVIYDNGKRQQIIFNRDYQITTLS